MVNFPRLQIVTVKVGIQTQAGWCQAWVLNHFPDFLSIVKLVLRLFYSQALCIHLSPREPESHHLLPRPSRERKPHPYFSPLFHSPLSSFHGPVSWSHQTRGKIQFCNFQLPRYKSCWYIGCFCLVHVGSDLEDYSCISLTSELDEPWIRL